MWAPEIPDADEKVVQAIIDASVFGYSFMGQLRRVADSDVHMVLRKTCLVMMWRVHNNYDVFVPLVVDTKTFWLILRHICRTNQLRKPAGLTNEPTSGRQPTA